MEYLILVVVTGLLAWALLRTPQAVDKTSQIINRKIREAHLLEQERRRIELQERIAKLDAAGVVDELNGLRKNTTGENTD